MGSGVASWPLELRQRHGRLLGALQSGAGWFGERLGLFGRVHDVELARVGRCVFVCRGNICRSAYAHARAAQLGLAVDSFGLDALGGARADAIAIEVAQFRGIDLSAHLAKPASQVELDPADLVLGMEPFHLLDLRGRVIEAGAQLSLLGLWASTPRAHLHDPFGLGRAYFETCFSIIDSAVEALAVKLRGPP